jgi:hypothetical protein
MTNAQRAEHVNQCIMHYEQLTNVDREDVLKDVLKDLLHWADEQGQDFDDALVTASMHHEAEVLLEERDSKP